MHVSTILRWLAIGTLVAALSLHAAGAAGRVSEVRLYALDCGRLDVRDLGEFDDTGELDGKPGVLASPCFLIRTPKGNLLWDNGLGDAIADRPGGVEASGFHFSVRIKLVDQLRMLGLKPSDIDDIAFSHLHLDHTGNSNLFGASTWILNRKELAAATAPTPPGGVEPNLFSAYKTAKVKLIDGDLDVFGDGSVRILATPGHTPGHQSLEIRLAKTGTVLLSGDLYHLRDSRRYRRVPTYNDSRAETLASMDRFEKIAAHTHARVVVQHDPQDFAALPRFPAYLD